MINSMIFHANSCCKLYLKALKPCLPCVVWTIKFFYLNSAGFYRCEHFTNTWACEETKKPRSNKNLVIWSLSK